MARGLSGLIWALLGLSLSITLFLGAGMPAVRTAVAQRRIAADCCPSCGYGLRGTPHGGPECGVARDASLNRTERPSAGADA